MRKSTRQFSRNQPVDIETDYSTAHPVREPFTDTRITEAIPFHWDDSLAAEGVDEIGAPLDI